MAYITFVEKLSYKNYTLFSVLISVLNIFFSYINHNIWNKFLGKYTFKYVPVQKAKLNELIVYFQVY